MRFREASSSQSLSLSLQARKEEEEEEGESAATAAMGRQSSRTGSSIPPSESGGVGADLHPHEVLADLEWPFGRIDSALRRSDLRETAYELFFMSCRSSPGFGGAGRLSYYPSSGSSGDGGFLGGSCSSGEISPRTPSSSSTGMMAANSRIKKALGLKKGRSAPMRAMSSSGSAGQGSPGKAKRPMTSAEIMRQQMRVTEQEDNRLRKTLVRAFVGKVGRKVETIILPLELLRQLRPSEFGDMNEYHQWQRRQLRILEAGLLHPSATAGNADRTASQQQLRDVVRSGELKPIDTAKNSDAMRALCASAVALAWRTPAASGDSSCHWADGYPFNVHLYLALLHSIFDLRDETAVLDEVDELVELMKKTWTTLGINRSVHNICFVWVLFQQYVVTGRVELDLAGAAVAMLAEVAHDARRDGGARVVSGGVLSSILGWAEKRLLDYHASFDGAGSVANMECILNLAIAASSVVGGSGGVADGKAAENLVDRYIRSSMKHAFTKALRTGSTGSEAAEEPSDILIHLARDSEELILVEKETFSPAFRRWHAVPLAAAAAAVHDCFGVVLKQYLGRAGAGLTGDLLQVLHSAGKLERVLVGLIVEDSGECDNGGKAVMSEMAPYEVESIVAGMLKDWIDERLRIGKECLARAKETESWIPRSKTEPFAQSAIDLMKLAKMTVDEFFEIPAPAAVEELAVDLSDGLESLLQDYTSFVSSCSSKQSYVPALPPLTRCNQDSRLTRFWKKAIMCGAGSSEYGSGGRNETSNDGHDPRPSTSRGTQRLYIRLNTLHFLLAHVQSLSKSLSFSGSGRRPSSLRLDASRAALQSAAQHVAEVAAYRLIFLDSNRSFYDGLYIGGGGVAGSRIRPALRLLKQNLTLLVTVVIDRAQPVAVKEVMKASFEVFMMILLAGGIDRAFQRTDYEMVAEDFGCLKRVFCTAGEGLVAEEVVEREAEVAEAIVELIGQPTERLIEDFSIAACELSGLGGLAGVAGQKVPMPPTAGRWNHSDPNTVLRVLCHRNDEVANSFLKRTFQLAKRS